MSYSVPDCFSVFRLPAMSKKCVHCTMPQLLKKVTTANWAKSKTSHKVIKVNFSHNVKMITISDIIDYNSMTYRLDAFKYYYCTITTTSITTTTTTTTITTTTTTTTITFSYCLNSNLLPSYSGPHRREPLGTNGASSYRVDIPSVTQSTASNHWRQLSAVTLNRKSTGPHHFWILQMTPEGRAVSLPSLALQYDTARYTIFTCTQKLTYSQLNLPHGTNKQQEQWDKN